MNVNSKYKDLVELLDSCSRLKAQDEIVIEKELLDQFLKDKDSNDVIIEAQRLLFPFNCSIYLTQEKVKIIKLK